MNQRCQHVDFAFNFLINFLNFVFDIVKLILDIKKSMYNGVKVEFDVVRLLCDIVKRSVDDNIGNNTAAGKLVTESRKCLVRFSVECREPVWYPNPECACILPRWGLDSTY